MRTVVNGSSESSATDANAGYRLGIGARSEPKRVICFSPHPDDDVISMGGTLIRLVQQKHQVQVAYMTSGNIAVFDHDAWRYIDFVAECNRLFGFDQEHTDAVKTRVQKFLHAKKPGQLDSPDVLQIKGLIRQTEARAAATVGCRC
jgi:glucosamine-6-phosphate deaminase